MGNERYVPKPSEPWGIRGYKGDLEPKPQSIIYTEEFIAKIREVGGRLDDTTALNDLLLYRPSRHKVLGLNPPPEKLPHPPPAWEKFVLPLERTVYAQINSNLIAAIEGFPTVGAVRDAAGEDLVRNGRHMGSARARWLKAIFDPFPEQPSQ